MRLDKFIGQATDLSRRQIHVLIKQSAVKINGEYVSNAATQVDANDEITLHGEAIMPPQIRYLMLHKPVGYVCANSDSDHPTVLDLIHLPRKNTLQIVGRLDMDTSGLVLLTDDGQWNHRITSPRSHCEKIYLCETAESIPESAVNTFAAGMMLHGESKPTLPAQLELLGHHTAKIKITEGKYHQVKRMFAAIGNRIVKLHRESIGKIQLDPQLQPGSYRMLTAAEIASIDDE
jgi:16S rRNA pseudouridine516 synthase